VLDKFAEPNPYALQDIDATTIEAASAYDERFISGSNKSHKQSAM
jgi:hypothetical protein